MCEPLKRGLVRILEAFKNALLPPRCLVCESLIGPPGDGAANCIQAAPRGSDPSDRRGSAGSGRLPARFEVATAAFLCAACRAEYIPVRPPVCTVCGRMFAGREGPDHLCGGCIETPKHYHKARAAAVSTPGLMKLIHQFKYNRKLQPAGPLSRLLFSAFCEHWPERDVQILMPVPLHTERLRQRGFNQAYLLVRDWPVLAGESDIRLKDMVIDKSSLVRRRRTRPQTGLGKRQRFRNVRNAFAVRAPENIRNKAVLLLDDVYTTGATVNECARVLLRNGALRVDVLTLARAE